MQHLIANIRFNHEVMLGSVGDLALEDACARPHGYHSAWWILEHCSCYRARMIALLDDEPLHRVDEAAFGYGAPDEEVLGDSLDEVRDRFLGLGEQWLHRLRELAPAAWEAEAVHIANGQTVTFAHNVTFWFWHESYHAGQLAFLRKALGYPTFA